MMGRGKWGRARKRASCKALLIAFTAVNVLIPPASVLGYSTGDGTEFTCGYADYAVHTHSEFCYDEDGNLWCELPEIAVHEHEESCYKILDIIDEDETHVHTDACYGTLVNGEVIPNVATASIAGVHTPSDADDEEIASTSNAKIMIQADAMTATPGSAAITEQDDLTSDIHTSSNAQVLICGILTQSDLLESELTCEQDEVILHIHDETCFDSDGCLLCEMLETVEHQHDANCITSCPLVLHEHTDECLAGAWPLRLLSAGEVSTVPSDSVDATVRLFNYDDNANIRTDGLGPSGYVFFQGNYVEDETDTMEGTVDGTGSGSNTYNKPVLQKLLNGGYPYVEDSEKGISGSLSYLFDEKGSYHEGTMTGGGGLFQQDDAGYYYYDSMKNAAYFDGESFHLYDCVVRPNYTSADGTDIQRSNFLPFNEVMDAVEVDTVLSDEANNVPAAKLLNPVDLWFGMTVEFDFLMPKNGQMDGEDMIFDFHGDDDVFVYIDDVLVLDIGGTHGAESGTINFHTGEAEDPNGNDGGRTLGEIFSDAGKELGGDTFADYTKHKLKFFYMERGGNISYCRLRFNMPLLPEKSLTVTKELTESGDSSVTEFLEDTLFYQFRVVKAGTDELYIQPGTAYNLLQNGAAAGGGIVDENGCFSLKAGQSAQFDNMLQKGEGETGYVVEELLPEKLTGQYAGVEYEVSGAGGETRAETGAVSGFTAYQTGILSAEETQTVTYRNKVDVSNLGTLKISKRQEVGTTFPEDQAFEIRVKLGGELLPAGTQYAIGDEVKEAADGGLITLKIGETATILKGILSGTDYEIVELGTEAGDFYANYSGSVTSGEDDKDIQEIDGMDTGVCGTFPLNGTVHVIVTNVNQKATGIVLPETGGSGALLYTIGGLLMAFASACALLLYKKHERKELHINEKHETTGILFTNDDHGPESECGSICRRIFDYSNQYQ